MRGGVFVVVLFVALALTSCGTSDVDDTVLVMAAASLTDGFAEIEAAFEAAHPDIDVTLNLAGSTSLREQILQGAPADVFASANVPTMQAVVTAGDAFDSAIFATNEMVMAVPLGNPAGIVSADDLADPKLFVGLCAARVPCGDFARQALSQLGVTASIDTNEGDVRALLTKIEAGELDVGMVYATDIASSEQVEGVALGAAVDVPIKYPIAALAESPNPEGAAAFVAFVLSSEGQRILASHGFGSP